MVKVFELAGDKVKQSVAQTLMQLIAEGAEAEEEEEEEGEEGGDRKTIIHVDADDVDAGNLSSSVCDVLYCIVG